LFKEHKNIIWGTNCDCGKECSILQSEHHPWDDTEFLVNLKCSSCNKDVIIDRERAARFYNEKIYSYYNNLEGSILDLGCGGGFLSRNLIKNNKITKVYGLDIDLESEVDLKDIIENPRFNFIHSDIDNINAIFQKRSIDYLVSRDVFMFIENTQKYFDDVTNIVTSGIKHMGWYIEGNKRMKNNLLPEQIAEEYIKRGWEVELEYLDWYKSGYFINAYK